MALHAYRYPEHLPLQLGGGYKSVRGFAAGALAQVELTVVVSHESDYPFKSKLCKDAAPHCYHEVWTAHPAPSHVSAVLWRL